MSVKSPAFNDKEYDLLKKLVENFAILVENP